MQLQWCKNFSLYVIVTIFNNVQLNFNYIAGNFNYRFAQLCPLYKNYFTLHCCVKFLLAIYKAKNRSFCRFHFDLFLVRGKCFMTDGYLVLAHFFFGPWICLELS